MNTRTYNLLSPRLLWGYNDSKVSTVDQLTTLLPPGAPRAHYPQAYPIALPSFDAGGRTLTFGIYFRYAHTNHIN